MLTMGVLRLSRVAQPLSGYTIHKFMTAAVAELDPPGYRVYKYMQVVQNRIACF